MVYTGNGFGACQGCSPGFLMKQLNKSSYSFSFFSFSWPNPRENQTFHQKLDFFEFFSEHFRNTSEHVQKHILRYFANFSDFFQGCLRIMNKSKIIQKKLTDEVFPGFALMAEEEFYYVWMNDPCQLLETYQKGSGIKATYYTCYITGQKLGRRL